MTKIEEIEALREAIIKKHYRWYHENMAIWNYQGNMKDVFLLEAEVDRKVIHYIKLGVNAEDIHKQLDKEIAIVHT